MRLSFSNLSNPLTKTVLRIKKYLGSKVDLLELKNLTENQVEFKNNIKYYEKLLVHRDKIDEAVSRLYGAVEEAQKDGVQLEDIKKLIQA